MQGRPQEKNDPAENRNRDARPSIYFRPPSFFLAFALAYATASAYSFNIGGRETIETAEGDETMTENVTYFLTLAALAIAAAVLFVLAHRWAFR
jgi:hypothetical protein